MASPAAGAAARGQCTRRPGGVEAAPSRLRGWDNARVERIHVADHAIAPDGKLDIPAIRPIARMGYYDYAVVERTFEMVIPSAGGAELAGLEGAPGA